MLTPTRFSAWLRTAAPGTTTAYHDGFLLIDRETDTKLATLCDAVRKAADEGFVILTQLKLGECAYTYRAHRTSEVY
jgi:hypothetical protein